jgi:hypothetical protein
MVAELFHFILKASVMIILPDSQLHKRNVPNEYLFMKTIYKTDYGY